MNAGLPQRSCRWAYGDMWVGELWFGRGFTGGGRRCATCTHALQQQPATAPLAGRPASPPLSAHCSQVDRGPGRCAWCRDGHTRATPSSSRTGPGPPPSTPRAPTPLSKPRGRPLAGWAASRCAVATRRGDSECTSEIQAGHVRWAGQGDVLYAKQAAVGLGVAACRVFTDQKGLGTGGSRCGLGSPCTRIPWPAAATRTGLKHATCLPGAVRDSSSTCMSGPHGVEWQRSHWP